MCPDTVDLRPSHSQVTPVGQRLVGTQSMPGGDLLPKRAAPPARQCELLLHLPRIVSMPESSSSNFARGNFPTHSPSRSRSKVRI